MFQELATEIILTLGEAFEIAYQIALREKQEEKGSLELSDDVDDDDVINSSSSSSAPPAAEASQPTSSTW